MEPTGFRRYTDDPKHGPLPLVLLLLTVVTGIVDAVSILSLGRVFVANMTGNIVFIGFALAGAPGFSLIASLSALVGFLVGAGIGGRAIATFGHHRGLLLRNVSVIQLALLIAAAIVLAVASKPFPTSVMAAVAALAALALGMQNAVVRKLAVPDLTTTVLTMTLTGLAADLRQRNGVVLLRRLLAIGAMMIGAIAGAILVLRVNAASALAVAVVLIAVEIAVLTVRSRHPAAWQHQN